jgi:hypothetical protein
LTSSLHDRSPVGNEPAVSCVFVTEQGSTVHHGRLGPDDPDGGRRLELKAHMLRYACGCALANCQLPDDNVVPGASGTARPGGRTRFSDRDLAPDFDNLIARQVEIICHVRGVVLHENE